MPRKQTINTTRLDIIQVATQLFFEKGIGDMTARAICDQLDISTGNLTFHFPTKEHLLAVIVEMMCDHQREMMTHFTDEGKSSLMAHCLELAVIAAMCEDNEIMRDFYLAAYTQPMTLGIIRRNDAERAMQIYAPYCAGWSDESFREAETLVSGIEYATIMKTDTSAPLDVRVAGALNGVMTVYGVPEDLRKIKVKKTLCLDYRAMARHIFNEFIEYVEIRNEQAIEALLRGRSGAVK